MILRRATPDDKERCGRIIFEAFGSIAEKHNFPHDFPTVDSALQMAEMTTANPRIYGVVAEEGGRIVGSNFLWEHDEIAGVGPITIAPELQSNGVGKKLMADVIERGKKFAGIRLVQDAFNSVSMSLYASLGFNIVEPLVLIQGTPKSPEQDDKIGVRPMSENDIEECSGLCRRIHGFDRKNLLTETRKYFPSYVATRDGRIAAYASAPNIWQLNHAVGESTSDMTTLLSGFAKATGESLSFLLPIRQAELFRWCLSQGLRVVKPMNLMAMGSYSEPKGSYLPSVLY